MSWKKIWPEIEDESLVVIPKSQGRTALQEVQDKIQRLKEARKNSMQEEDGANTALVIFPLPMMCRSILSSLTETCTLQVHASEMLIDRIADIY